MADFLEDLDAAIRGEEPDSSHSSRRNRTDKEKAVLVPLIGLTKACKNCLKKVRTAVKENGSTDTLEKIAQLDKIAEEVRRISPQLDELVSGMYTPVNMSALQGNVSTTLGQCMVTDKSCIVGCRGIELGIQCIGE